MSRADLYVERAEDVGTSQKTKRCFSLLSSLSAVDWYNVTKKVTSPWFLGDPPPASATDSYLATCPI